jgi:hypothetical protein
LFQNDHVSHHNQITNTAGLPNHQLTVSALQLMSKESLAERRQWDCCLFVGIWYWSNFDFVLEDNLIYHGLASHADMVLSAFCPCNQTSQSQKSNVCLLLSTHSYAECIMSTLSRKVCLPQGKMQ